MKYLDEFLKRYAHAVASDPQNRQFSPDDSGEPAGERPQNPQNLGVAGAEDRRGQRPEEPPDPTVSAIDAESPPADTGERPSVPGWTYANGRWYAPGFEGLETPFDERGAVNVTERVAVSVTSAESAPAAPAAEAVTPPLKWHGGKSPLTSWILSAMPPHLHYVEPFAGGLHVLLAKNPIDVSEVANDLDGLLMNFWRVLQDEALFARFRRRVQAVPFAEPAWLEAQSRLSACTGEPADAGETVDRAVWLFILCRQSLAGRMDDFAPLSRNRTRRGMNEQASAWITAVDGLPAVHERLRRVVLFCEPAVDVIRREDGPDTLFYCDPPYVHETRTARGVYGAYEMTDDDHRELLDLLRACEGKAMVSGYPNALYDEALGGWTRHERLVANHAAAGASKRRMTEVLWCNW
jgi:DNA adenine methylase